MQDTESEVIEITLEKKIETELVKSNVTQAVINTLKDRYSGMKLTSLTDKESYLELKQAAKDCSKVRNLAVKCCKAGREDAIAIQKLWVAKEKEVVGQITEIEAPLDEEIAKFDAEVERLANEEKRLQEEQYMHRTQALTKIGAVYSEGSFSLGGYSIEANLIKESAVDTWNDTIYPKFDTEYQKLESVKIEEQRLAEEYKAALKKQQDEMAEQQRLLREQQDEFERQKNDDERKKQEEQHRKALEFRESLEKRTRKRTNQLSALGMTYNFQYDAFVYEDVNIDNKTEINLFSEDEWDQLVAKITPVIQDRKTAAELRKQEKIEQDKKDAAELAAKQERQRIEEENRLAEIKRQQDEQRKAEELAKAGDTAQWDNFIEQVKKITVPNVKSGQYRKIGAIAKEKLEEIVNLKV